MAAGGPDAERGPEGGPDPEGEGNSEGDPDPEGEGEGSSSPPLPPLRKSRGAPLN